MEAAVFFYHILDFSGCLFSFQNCRLVCASKLLLKGSIRVDIEDYKKGAKCSLIYAYYRTLFVYSLCYTEQVSLNCDQAA
jgi:hypothetical protein